MFDGQLLQVDFTICCISHTGEVAGTVFRALVMLQNDAVGGLEAAYRQEDSTYPLFGTHWTQWIQVTVMFAVTVAGASVLILPLDSRNRSQRITRWVLFTC